jgi:hypothetical protein
MAQHSHFPALEIKAKPRFMFTNGGVQFLENGGASAVLNPFQTLVHSNSYQAAMEVLWQFEYPGLPTFRLCCSGML